MYFHSNIGGNKRLPHFVPNLPNLPPGLLYYLYFDGLWNIRTVFFKKKIQKNKRWNSAGAAQVLRYFISVSSLFLRHDEMYSRRGSGMGTVGKLFMKNGDRPASLARVSLSSVGVALRCLPVPGVSFITISLLGTAESARVFSHLPKTGERKETFEPVGRPGPPIKLNVFTHV